MWTAAVCAASALLVLPASTSPLGRLGKDGPAPGDAEPVAVADSHSVAATFDLLAACLRGGLPVGTAAAAVADTAPEPLGTALRTTADLLVLGADADAAWAPVEAEPDIESLARMARRSARSGASLADGIAELADERRAQAEDAAAAATERAGVLISGPLGLCFLPAFVCLGIVPVVVGLARTVLGGGLL
ncbi:type II secretion system F family protein [Rhodococcus sp. BP-252]|uniref:Type II secretion system protein GspF domain-containing protein n=1 Tax=Rhodococcoides kyotonense TaxID=398843 RepID=A0A177YEH6_9NOCA|nr:MULTISPECIES: type II secretion system F family protein [Rhodococcus]MBY6410899.1 type II secretion system F family protein [Rhodococcus sp. BP-320]MBY6415276.1 type II secretion system F family protein [Rhodococcus sp. BP-321]MBY6419891.1 type II secretion system F family protein [Rhodococcus sp. BP-324]MBY6425455.1 type II secretion system F family protein [Rhodococcus sp. BP-323]MBY6430482.1 type II secretion system F family protein [Rhodococcus sp. BP-322]